MWIIGNSKKFLWGNALTWNIEIRKFYRKTRYRIIDNGFKKKKWYFN